MGFTLIELMVALVVASVAIGGYVAANILAQRNAEDMFERTVALQDANRVIEQLRSTSRSGAFPENVIARYPHNNSINGINHLANEQITVTYASTTANPLAVTVTVTWFSYTGRTNSEAVQTYITQR